MPQDAKSMVDWRWRVALFIEPQRTFPQGLLAYTDEQLIGYAKQFGATYLVIPQRHTDMVEVSSNLIQIYPPDPAAKATYVVFKFANQ